jgi:hypothetical protein
VSQLHDKDSWPIVVRLHDYNSTAVDTHQQGGSGVMDPELLLLYGVERISLPSGESVFRFLARQAAVQRLLVQLFWFIKCRMFQPGSINEQAHLLGLISEQYVLVFELLCAKARAQHEKDLVFLYLPYVLGSGVFFGAYEPLGQASLTLAAGFFYACPGSRHLYGKRFRGIIYMQMVNILYGIHLCPLSLKVREARLLGHAYALDEGHSRESLSG